MSVVDIGCSRVLAIKYYWWRYPITFEIFLVEYFFRTSVLEKYKTNNVLHTMDNLFAGR